MKKALIQLHIAVLLWGFTGVLGRAISLDAPMLVWYRTLLTAVIMAVILTVRKQWIRISRRDLLQMMAVGSIIAIHWVAFYGAIKFANASIALVCLSTASVFTSIFSPLINKAMFSWAETALGLLALVGVFLIYSFQQFYGLGILFGVIAAILSAIFTMMNKQIAHRYPARTMVFYEMTSGWLFITLLMPLYLAYFPNTNRIPLHPDLLSATWMHNDWLWLGVLSLCCTVWAQSLAMSSLKNLSPFTVTLSVNLEPVYGIVLAFFFYQENKDLHTGFYLGMGLILITVILQMVRLLQPAWKAKYRA